MAKPGLPAAKVRRLLREAAKNCGWTLCIGAGASHGIFPLWDELATALAERDPAVGNAPQLIKALAERYSLNSLIEAARDRLTLDEDSYRGLLANELYRGLKAAAGPSWPACARCLSAGHPSAARPTDWQEFHRTITANFPGASAIELAKFVIRAQAAELPPLAVLSFNAEPLLFALCNASVVEESLLSRQGQTFQTPESRFDRVIRSTSNRRPGRVPFTYCHGLLPVPDVDPGVNECSVDKLVFAEGEYLQLANATFSWQSSVFLGSCSSSVVVFVGVSLSDSNMRTWLSWAHSNRLHELRNRDPGLHESSRHFWIEVEPAEPVMRFWLESLVANLGVRIIWLKDWSALGALLSALL